jgi:hypothetical protein
MAEADSRTERTDPKRERARPRMAGALPLVLAAFGVAQLALGIGLWATPGTFFEEIGPYGERNDHYMGDLATFYLALGAGSLVAVVRSSWRVPVLAVALVQYALHSVNHLIDVGDADPGWLGPANLIAIAAATALLAWMFKVARR